MNFLFSPWDFFLVFGRTSFLVGFFPMFSDVQVPRLIRLGLAIWLSLVIMPTLPTSHFHPTNVPQLLGAMFLEGVLGATFAFAIRLVFATISLGTQWIDSEIGFQVAQQISPLSGTPNSPFGTIALVITALLFWCTGMFEELLRVWVQMFQILPPPVSSISLSMGDALITLSSHVFVGALQIATPVLLIMFLVSLSIGLLARALPGVNFFVESFNVKMVVGLSFLVMISPFLLSLIQHQLDRIPDTWLTFLRALKAG